MYASYLPQAVSRHTTYLHWCLSIYAFATHPSWMYYLAWSELQGLLESVGDLTDSVNSLPALREFQILSAVTSHIALQPHIEAFLRKHGSKIHSMRLGRFDLPILELCSNMTCLSLYVFDVGSIRNPSGVEINSNDSRCLISWCIIVKGQVYNTPI